jgi:hypothetical protein
MDRYERGRILEKKKRHNEESQAKPIISARE